MIRQALIAACLSACAAPRDQHRSAATDSAGMDTTVAQSPTMTPARTDTILDGPADSSMFDLPLSVVREGESACYHYADLTVAAKRRVGESGSDIFIRLGPGAPCTYDSLPGDWVLRNEWAEYFMSKAGSTILLDSGTGIRSTVIFWNIQTRTKYYEGAYAGEILERGGREIGLWRTTSIPLTSKGCAEESQAVVEQVTWVEVTTGKETPGEEFRCGFQE